MSKCYKSISNKYIDSTSIVHNRKLLSDLLDVKYISSHGWSLSVSTTSDCYADIQFSFNGWDMQVVNLHLK
jgi:hypothetical protein